MAASVPPAQPAAATAAPPEPPRNSIPPAASRKSGLSAPAIAAIGLGVAVARSGTSLRVRGAAFRSLLAESAEFRRIVRGYTVVLRGNVERWTALPGNSALGAPLLSRLNAAIARQH